MFHCTLCGAASCADIHDEPDERVGRAWLNNVRAILIDGTDYLSPQLSNVAYRNESRKAISLPRDHGCHTEMVMLRWAAPTLLPDGTLPPDSAVSGYVVHENCWKLLSWALYPQPVNVQTLNLFFRSFGTMPECQVVTWGHTYGGLFASNDADNWSIHLRNERGYTVGTRIWKANPSIVENDRIQDQLTSWGSKGSQVQSKSEEQSVASGDTPSLTPADGQDCFEDLPPELLENVIMFLPSEDVLPAKLASRAIARLQLSKAFWYSRFWPGQEYEYLIEPLLHKAGAITEAQFSDPKIVYDFLRTEPESLVLANRRRIHELLRPIVSGLQYFASHEKRFGTTEPSGRALASLWQPELEDEDTARWECAYGELLDSELQPYHFGCRPLFKRLVVLAKDVVAVHVSVLPFHSGVTYVTGLRFCLADNTEETIGYILQGKETMIQTGGVLRGFHVVASNRGIHGLGILNKDGRIAATAGLKKENGGRRLGWGESVRKVKAYFDGMKMVYLAVPSYIHNGTGPYSLWKQARQYIEIASLTKS
ncbi:hypothetical protein BKA63DRAFT_504385 [Paraphoma chrysanthemicola]|nr:hypothetical protein BKA63DRAFT_504385 [Paraphoma chrysanthemicola]